jgi:hypothetical protein
MPLSKSDSVPLGLSLCGLHGTCIVTVTVQTRPTKVSKETY